MKEHKHKEHIQRKLYSMASILMGNIIIPSQEEQEGSDSIVASWYDEVGNKYSFTLSLNVVPPIKADTEEDETVTVADQIAIILSKLDALDTKVGILEQKITSEDSGSSTDQPTTGDNDSTQGDDNG